jgi:D-beta-D-heptose 7-phosphate kinase/D-beta-D-heptose 1-phosphate adenosyltransferase
MTSGGFDPLHPGHISCIVDSKNHGDVLVVVVNGDWFLSHMRGRPFMDLETRCEIISAIRGVDYVVAFEVENDLTVGQALKAIRPRVFTKGGQRENRDTIPEWTLCKRFDIQIVTGVGDSKEHSSSSILEDWYHHRLRLFSESA